MSKKISFPIILDGPMGSGKTTVAELLHSKLSRTAFLSWDSLKWMVNGLENASEDKQMIAHMRLGMAKLLLGKDISVIVEGGFLKKERLRPYFKFAKQHNVRLFHYFLTAPENILLRRAAGRPETQD